MFGSGIFYFAIHLVDTLTYALKFRYTQPELSTSQYVFLYVQQFIVGLLFVTVMDSVLALPIMGAIHYLGESISAQRRSKRTQPNKALQLTAR